MARQSPHKRWKGCCMMCAAFIRGDGTAHRRSGSELKRSFDGKKRRMKRNDVPTKEEW